MIPGQDDEAVRKWDECQRRNRPAGQPTKIVQCRPPGQRGRQGHQREQDCTNEFECGEH